jgi:hypothetical protein
MKKIVQVFNFLIKILKEREYQRLENQGLSKGLKN